MKETINSCNHILLNNVPEPLKKIGVIPSGPNALLGCKEKTAFLISSSKIGLVNLEFIWLVIDSEMPCKIVSNCPAWIEVRSF